ncbi:MAG: hypothetical protein RSB80_00965 [Anaerovoracaceae bacterium]
MPNLVGMKVALYMDIIMGTTICKKLINHYHVYKDEKEKKI